MNILSKLIDHLFYGFLFGVGFVFATFVMRKVFHMTLSGIPF